MTLVPGAAGGLPLYRQLADHLRRQIKAGAYGDGGRLPPEGDLAGHFGVSRITVRAALDRLAAEGLVQRQRGRGTFVAATRVEQPLDRLTDFAEEMSAAGLRATARVLALTEEVASEPVADALRLAPGASVTRLDRLRLADRAPFALDIAYLPLRYGALLDRDRLAEETLLHHLETRYGIAIVAGRFQIEAAAAIGEIARLLALPHGAPLLLLHRTLLGDHDEPVCYQRRSYDARRVRYRIDLRRDAPGARAALTDFVPEVAAIEE